MEYPKIYLALDNCFALKRWVEPETWLPLIKDLGYTSIQASYDNEFDMLYNTKEYIDSWYTSFAAGAVLISIPIAALFLYMQKYYVDGVSGAVKG